jgi:hypothetical protein
MDLKAVIYLIIVLLWTLACLAYRLWLPQSIKAFHYYQHQPQSPCLITLQSIGAGLLTAWLIQWLMVDGRSMLAHLLILFSIVLGFSILIVPIPRPTHHHQPRILEVFPNQFGLFHIRLDRAERLGQNWEGHTLSELDLRKKNLLVLAVIRGEEIIPFPKGPEMLRCNDDLLIFGAMGELSLAENAKIIMDRA